MNTKLNIITNSFEPTNIETQPSEQIQNESIHLSPQEEKQSDQVNNLL